MTTANLPARRTVTAVAVPTPTETTKKPLTQAQKDNRWVIGLAVKFPAMFLTAMLAAYLISRIFPR